MVVIAISGKHGSGSSTSGALLAKKLGVKFYSIGKYHKSFGVSEKESERTMEAWEHKKEELNKFEHEKDDLSRKLASEGNVVIDGKLAVHMIKNADLKVWLTATEDIRASRYSNRDDVTPDRAKDILTEKESKEREVWKKTYDLDYFTQEEEADLVIDTSDKDPEKIVEMIIKKLEER